MSATKFALTFCSHPIHPPFPTCTLYSFIRSALPGFSRIRLACIIPPPSRAPLPPSITPYPRPPTPPRTLRFSGLRTRARARCSRAPRESPFGHPPSPPSGRTSLLRIDVAVNAALAHVYCTVDRHILIERDYYRTSRHGLPCFVLCANFHLSVVTAHFQISGTSEHFQAASHGNPNLLTLIVRNMFCSARFPLLFCWAAPIAIGPGAIPQSTILLKLRSRTYHANFLFRARALSKRRVARALPSIVAIVQPRWITGHACGVPLRLAARCAA